MRRLVLALSAASLLACGDSSGPEVSSAVGTWNLVTVNGSQLPYTLVLFQPSYRLEILSSQYIAAENGTYVASATWRETENGTVTTTSEPDNGTWSQTGSTVTVTSAVDGGVSTATISGNTITLSEQGFVSVYHRQ
jgi:hypothetical protein